MPTAPDFAGDESSYFGYLGAEVESKPSLTNSPLAVVKFQGENVALLVEKDDYTRLDSRSIMGRLDKLCRLARGQRVILSHDQHWSYIVQQKSRSGTDAIAVFLRRGKPITNIQPILAILGAKNG